LKLRPISALLIVGFLSSCDLPKTWTEEDIREMAREETRYVANVVDTNAGKSNDLSERVERLESEVEDLNSKIDFLEAENALLRAELSY
jgi:predicted nuclease with TOPRIM domain